MFGVICTHAQKDVANQKVWQNRRSVCTSQVGMLGTPPISAAGEQAANGR